MAYKFLSACGSSKTPKVYHVGILSGLEGFADVADGFKAGMTELGYIEGQNIIYDVQKSNLIKSVREPGGNITGVRYPGPGLAAKSLEILHEIAPQAKRIWVPYLQGYPSIPDQLDVLRKAAAAAGITLIEVPSADAAGYQADLEARAKSADLGLDAILTIYEPLALSPDVNAMLREFSTEHKVIYAFDVFVVWIDNVQSGKLAAPLADKIFKGIPAGTIPVYSPEGFLQVNLKVAQEKGLTVPDGILQQADKIIRE